MSLGFSTVLHWDVCYVRGWVCGACFFSRRMLVMGIVVWEALSLTLTGCLPPQFTIHASGLVCRVEIRLVVLSFSIGFLGFPHTTGFEFCLHLSSSALSDGWPARLFFSHP